jgi:hypothetical protein
MAVDVHETRENGAVRGIDDPVGRVLAAKFLPPAHVHDPVSLDGDGTILDDPAPPVYRVDEAPLDQNVDYENPLSGNRLYSSAFIVCGRASMMI